MGRMGACQEVELTIAGIFFEVVFWNVAAFGRAKPYFVITNDFTTTNGISMCSEKM